jgi:phytoene dehydrogenase-like protein
MFKALYFEGFSRPVGGVRTILSLLMKKLQDAGGEICFKTSVSEILVNDRGEAYGVLAAGEEVLSPIIFSSIGYPETVKLTPRLETCPRSGSMTFLESIFVFDQKIPLEINDSTINFFNNSSHYSYRPAEDYFDSSSAVICYPDNYEPSVRDGEGVVRVTYMANYQQWHALPRERYEEMKNRVGESAFDLVKKLNPGFGGKLRFKDVFSPTTIERYTWHMNGAVYGSIDKTRDGRTPVKNLFIIGTDQGFLGIVGAMLSGISMSNLHGLMNGGEG